MSYDVFIAHSHRDKTVADMICTKCEVEKMRCWISPRDIPVGMEWVKGVMRGLDSCRVMVLVYSPSTAESPSVRREVEYATKKGSVIIPFRITEDAEPLEDNIRELVRVVKRSLSAGVSIEQSAVSLPDQETGVVSPQHRPITPARQTSEVKGTLLDVAKREQAGGASPAQGVVAPPKPSSSETGFIFISYSRTDLTRIVPFMHRIVNMGYPIWYDRGIPGSAEWDTLIEDKVSHCELLLVFLSEAAVESKWVRREIKFADSEKRPILGVRLDNDVALKHGLKIVMSQYQMIDASEADFADEIRKTIEYVRLL